MENYIKIADYATELKQQETNTPAVLKISVGIRIHFQQEKNSLISLFQHKYYKSVSYTKFKLRCNISLLGTGKDTA